MAAVVLPGCARALPPDPKSLFVTSKMPAAWPSPRPELAGSPPQIQALRFSSLAARAGTDWDGDILTSTNAASVELGTKLFAFRAPRLEPGRFHFRFHLVDVPAELVRPYDLQITARNASGELRRVDVPFRITGRSDVASTYNADARSTDALEAPPLIDMNGRSVNLRDGVTVLAFVYTRCADPRMCPLVTAKFARMSALLADSPVRLVEITLDPAFDTPAVLRSYARAFGADGVRWTMATGERASVAAFAERCGLYVDRPRPGLILHTEAVLVARDGFLEGNFSGNDWTAGEVAAEARAIAALPANPVARFALRLFAGVVRTCGGVAARGFTPAILLGTLAALTLIGALVFFGLTAHGRRPRPARGTSPR